MPQSYFATCAIRYFSLSDLFVMEIDRRLGEIVYHHSFLNVMAVLKLREILHFSRQAKCENLNLMPFLYLGRK